MILMEVKWSLYIVFSPIESRGCIVTDYFATRHWLGKQVFSNNMIEKQVYFVPEIENYNLGRLATAQYYTNDLFSEIEPKQLVTSAENRFYVVH